MQAKTLDEVIICLDTIIGECRRQNSRVGYFACLYRKMTVAIQAAIADGAFADGDRMEKLDVVFANRYLEAYTLYSEGRLPTLSWQTAFNAAGNDKLTVLQHLLLGVNAHINLDLGIAAAKISTPETIADLASDFNKVNEVIGTLLADVQSGLAGIAFPMHFIRKINPEKTNAILNFSIAKARQTAWGNALLIAEIGEQGEQNVVNTTDRVVTRVAGAIQMPGRLMRLLLKWIRWTESNDIAKNMNCLL